MIIIFSGVPLERLNMEIQRRSSVADPFAGRISVIRLLAAWLMEIAIAWEACGRRFSWERMAS
jgi:transposase-like protein